MRIVVGISGASGAIYGVRVVQHLKKSSAEVHLVISNAAKITLQHECAGIITLEQLEQCCYKLHSYDDIGASIASGSFSTAGMIVAPCSIRTMSEIASGIASSLLTRAADVTLKERRKLVLMLRETPLHLGHLRTMTALAETGAIIAPPIPSFYHNPQNIIDIVDHSVARVLSIFGLWDGSREWKGLESQIQ